MKTITMTEFRSEPGERLRDVQRGGKAFLITKGGKPAAQLVPVSWSIENEENRGSTIILPDGRVLGPAPLTMRRDLDGGY